MSRRSPVSMVAIPRRGRPGLKRQKLESEESFRDLVKWRTDPEGRISYLKRSWGFERRLFDGMTGVKTWCGWGVRPQRRQDRTHDRRQEQRQADTDDPGEVFAYRSAADILPQTIKTIPPRRLISAPPRPLLGRPGQSAQGPGWRESGEDCEWFADISKRVCVLRDALTPRFSGRSS